MSLLVSIALLACLVAFVVSTVRFRRLPNGPRPFTAAAWGCLLAGGLVAGSDSAPMGFGLAQALAGAFPPLLLAGEYQRAKRELPRSFFPLFAALVLLRGVSFAVDPRLPTVFAFAVDVPLLLLCAGIAWRGSDRGLPPGAHALPLALGLLAVPRIVDAWFDLDGTDPLATLPLWAAVAVPTAGLQLWAGLSEARRETKEAKKALAASVQRFEAIANGTLDLVSELDPEGRFVYVSPSYRTALGWEPEELLGTNSLELVHPDEREAIFQFGEAVEVRGEMPHPRLRMRHKNGSWRVLEGVTRRYWNEEGQERFVVVDRDVSDRLRLERDARNAQRFESLQLLAKGIAHDLNNRLVPVLTSADLMRRELPADSPQDELLSDLEEGAQRATELSRQLLDLSGYDEERRTSIELSALVGEVTRLFVRTLPDRVSLHSKLSPGTPLIEGDPSRLRQMVTSLLANAIEALGSEGGSIEVTTGVVEIRSDARPLLEMNAELAPGAYVNLDVHDDGTGIDPEMRDLIFDPFVSTKPAGRGLGLAVLMGTVQTLGGAVGVHSRPGQGTLFRVLLPPASTAAQDVSEAEGAPPSRWNGRGRILLVDDEETVRRAARRALESLGFTVVEARNGGEAIGIFRRNPMDIAAVVLDAVMPELSGEQTCGELHKIRPGAPVLLTSGYIERGVVDRLTARPGVRFLPKPYSIAALGHAMRELLDPESESSS